jgi:3-oxoadipate enol-lactonase
LLNKDGRQGKSLLAVRNSHLFLSLTRNRHITPQIQRGTAHPASTGRQGSGNLAASQIIQASQIRTTEPFMSEPEHSARGLAYTRVSLCPPWVGRRPPVVFNHGIGTTRDVWAGWLPEIASRHDTVRFDLRGYGRSVVPPKEHVWTLDEFVADLLDVAAITGPGPYHLVGESAGGTVVLAAAARHPDKVASATVSNTAFKGSGIQYVKGWRAEMRRAGMRAWSRGMMEKRFVQGVLDEARRAWFEAEQEKSIDYVTAGVGEMLAAVDLTAELPKLKAPLLVLMPDRSPFVTARMAAELAELVPQAEVAMYPGVRHGLPFSHAAECSARLAEFLDRAERHTTGRANLPKP